MKKPATMNENGQAKKGGKRTFKEFWANKSTRWTVIAFAIVLLVTIGEFVLMAVVK